VDREKILGQEQARSDLSTFENCWSQLLGREYDDLRNYCGDNARVIPEQLRLCRNKRFGHQLDRTQTR
jgi:hypothetical protein